MPNNYSKILKNNLKKQPHILNTPPCELPGKLIQKNLALPRPSCLTFFRPQNAINLTKKNKLLALSPAPVLICKW